MQDLTPKLRLDYFAIKVPCRKSVKESTLA
jgi:hypothetical protein